MGKKKRRDDGGIGGEDPQRRIFCYIRSLLSSFCFSYFQCWSGHYRQNYGIPAVRLLSSPPLHPFDRDATSCKIFLCKL
ncbi:hypothetical protein Plhal304r1_c020g0071141 [Plasmopara halstedii]